MRVQAALWVVGVVAACAAVSAVALAQGSTWGGAAPPAGVVDAGSPAHVVPGSTWGGAAAQSAGAADAGSPTVPSTWGTAAGVAVAPAPAVPARDGGAPVHAVPAADGGTDADASTEPASSPPSDVGLSIGIRGGYAIPMGTGNAGSLSSVVQGVAPIGADVGWFFTPKLYIGAYFLYGFGINPGVGNDFCSDPDTECSATMYRFGVVAHWHFRPHEAIDPWVGAGLGYEVVNVIANSDVDGLTVAAAALQGFNLNLEAGLDFKPLSYVGLGPYVELASGQYILVESFSPHAWFSFGLRLRTNL